MLKLDIRTKIFILIIANILMFKMMSISMHLVIALCFSIYLGISSNFKRMIRFFGIYLFFTAYEVFFAHTVTLQVVDSFLLLTALMFKTLYFPLCAGMALVSSSKVSELICFLRSIRLPKCLCRGIDNEEKPTSYIELKFNKIDYLVMVAVTIIFCFIMFMR